MDLPVVPNALPLALFIYLASISLLTAWNYSHQHLDFKKLILKPCFYLFCISKHMLTYDSH